MKIDPTVYFHVLSHSLFVVLLVKRVVCARLVLGLSHDINTFIFLSQRIRFELWANEIGFGSIHNNIYFLKINHELLRK